uniref:exodeoxyribonuclease III n=1 Tax=Oryzias latipes TaxID=8090 RepID=A0A3B3IJ21_ORYLA
MNSLNIVSWNVRGLGSGPKRLKVLSHLDDLKADIALLQETHLSTQSQDLLCSSKFPVIYSSSYNSKQRGVAVLINKNVTFTHKDTVTDPEGRFVIINISIQNKDYCIASIYGPNVDDSSFFHRFFTSLSVHSDSTIIIGGDVNLVLDPELDRLSTAAAQRTWRIYYTGQRMFKMGLSNSDICQHCDSNLPDNYMHALWFCTPVQALWQQVCADLSVWLKVSITASPSLCVLGDMSAIDVEGGLGSIIFITLCIAKKTILTNWKSKKNINISQHRNLLLDQISLEKMSAQGSSNFERIRSLWSPIADSVT